MPTAVVSDMCASSGSESTSEYYTPCKKPRISIKKNSLIEKRSKKFRKATRTPNASKIPRTQLTFQLKNFQIPLPANSEQSSADTFLQPLSVALNKPLTTTTSTNSSPKLPLRKSLSETQMEYKRKNVQKSAITRPPPPVYYPNTKGFKSSYCNGKSNQHCACSSSCELVRTGSNSKSSVNTVVSRSVPINDDDLSSVCSHETLFYDDLNKFDPRLTGMKVFSSIMLNAWRHRRAEVRNLTEDIKSLRSANLKVKNQVHVLNQTYKVEKKRLADMSARFQLISDEHKKLQNKYDKLNNMLIDQKSFSKIYECQLLAKDKEFEGINMVLDETKTNLFQSMSTNREIEKKLSCAQRNILELQNNKNDLINQTFKINAQKFKIQEEIKAELAAKQDELTKANTTIDLLEKRLIDLKIKESQVVEYEGRDIMQKSLISDLKVENENLRNELQRSMGSRMLALMNNKILPTAGTTLRYMHLFTYYLLPATPPPRASAFPFKFSVIKTFCGSYSQ